MAMVGEGVVADVALRLREDASSRLWSWKPCRWETNVEESTVVDRVDFERDRDEVGDNVVGEGKILDELEVSR